MKSALLVIDVQHYLCNGKWAAFDIENVIARINALSAEARAAGVPVVLIQHEEGEGALAHGSEGWQMDPRVATAPSDLRIRKTACDSFHQTPLDSLLRERGVDTLVICGLQSEYCVDSTTRGALAHGYPVTLVADAHSTVDNNGLTAAQITAHHNETLANLGSYGVRVSVIPAAAATAAMGRDPRSS